MDRAPLVLIVGLASTSPSREIPSSCTVFRSEYEPRSPESTVVHQVIAEHLETFLEAARNRDGSGVPGFVERAFRKVLDCGCPARGFARLRCDSCGFERLLPYSCKHSGGLCSSCSGRRMAALSAHLVDHVFPKVPTRQWVLTLPFSLRYKLAWNHELTKSVLSQFYWVIAEFYREKAEAQGVVDGRTGAVTAIQRVGSAINLNVHFHSEFLDGTFARGDDGALHFHPLDRLTDDDVAELVTKVRARILRLLHKEGVFDDGQFSFAFDELSDESASLSGMYGASVQGRVSMGDRAGLRVRRIGSDPNAPWIESSARLQARVDGFDLHAGVLVGANDRERLERVCRYLLRPPVPESRLELRDDGMIVLELKNEFSDGTTHLLYNGLEFLEKIATLVTRPRIKQLIYHGVFAPNAAWRQEVVAYGRKDDGTFDELNVFAHADGSGHSFSWKDLLKRVFLIEALSCPRCGSQMRVIANIDDPAVIQRILNHLGLPTSAPSTTPSRIADDFFDPLDDFYPLDA